MPRTNRQRLAREVQGEYDVTYSQALTLVGSGDLPTHDDWRSWLIRQVTKQLEDLTGQSPAWLSGLGQVSEATLASVRPDTTTASVVITSVSGKDASMRVDVDTDVCIRLVDDDVERSARLGIAVRCAAPGGPVHQITVVGAAARGAVARGMG